MKLLQFVPVICHKRTKRTLKQRKLSLFWEGKNQLFQLKVCAEYLTEFAVDSIFSILDDHFAETQTGKS